MATHMDKVTPIVACGLLLALIACAGTGQGAGEAPLAQGKGTAPWLRIHYPQMHCRTCNIDIQPIVRAEESGKGFAVHLLIPVRNEEIPEARTREMPKGKDPAAPYQQDGAVRVRLHLPGGVLVAPSPEETRIMFGITSGLGATGYIINTFAWQPGCHGPARLEVQLPGDTYWLDMPAGALTGAIPKEPGEGPVLNPKPSSPQASRSGGTCLAWRKIELR